MNSIGRNHAKGTLFFQSHDGWTACTPEFAANVKAEDFPPQYFGIARRVLEKQRPAVKKPEDQQQLF